MKAGILTYHNTLNYGAALQVYATQKALNSLGVESEVIDYSNDHREEIYNIKNRLAQALRERQILTSIKLLLGYIIINSRKKKFEMFYQENLTLSKQEFRDPVQLKKTVLDYDYYIVGSDQVWNYDHNGKDLNYLLDFVVDKSKTISYASSFGLESISKEIKDEYEKLLNSIRYLSVRERKGAEIISSLTGRKANIVLDPVFLLDKEHWLKMARNYEGVTEPYILVYTTKSEYFNKFIEITGYDTDGVDIALIGTGISIGEVFKRNSRIVFAASPEQFLGLINNARLVITSSFHGTAFSIIMEKQFISFLSGNPGKDARISELLERLGLQDRVFHNEMTLQLVQKPIDYNSVNITLDALRKESKMFLNKALTISI